MKFEKIDIIIPKKILQDFRKRCDYAKVDLNFKISELVKRDLQDQLDLRRYSGRFYPKWK